MYALQDAVQVAFMIGGLWAVAEIVVAIARKIGVRKDGNHER